MSMMSELVKELNERAWEYSDQAQLIRKAAVAIEGLSEKGRNKEWFPANQVLPAARKSVIISTKHWTGEGCHWETTEDHVIWKGYRWNATYWDDEVTAWMELPEPYRKDDDEE